MINGTGNGKPESNQSQISWIVRTLAAVLVICVVGIFMLLYGGKPVPNELWMLTSQSFAGLAAMLAKTYATPTSTPTPSEQKPSGTVTVPEQQLETKT